MKILVFIATVLLNSPAYSDSKVRISDDVLDLPVAELVLIRYQRLCVDWNVKLEDAKKKLRKTIEYVNPKDSSFFLQAAIMSDSIPDIERALIENPTLEIDFGESALHLAAEYSEPETLRYLIGLNVFDLDQGRSEKYSSTALDTAVIHNRRRIIDVLLDAGADINAGNPFRNIMACKAKSMFLYLMDKGALLDDKARDNGKKLGVELEE